MPLVKGIILKKQNRRRFYCLSFGLFCLATTIDKSQGLKFCFFYLSFSFQDSTKQNKRRKENSFPSSLPYAFFHSRYPSLAPRNWRKNIPQFLHKTLYVHVLYNFLLLIKYPLHRPPASFPLFPLQHSWNPSPLPLPTTVPNSTSGLPNPWLIEYSVPSITTSVSSTVQNPTSLS